MSNQIDPFEGAPELPRIVAVSFLSVGHLYNFLAGGLTLARGDRVVVEGEAGVRIGTVEVEPHEPSRTLDFARSNRCCGWPSRATSTTRRKISTARRRRGGFACIASASATCR